jgi:hypothetical protein
LKEGAELFITVFPDVKIKRLTAQVVKHDAVVVDAHFDVRKVKIIYGCIRNVLLVADGVIGDIADSVAEESVSMLSVTLAANEPLNGV